MSVWGIDPSTKRVSCGVRGLDHDAWVVESVGVETPQGGRLSLIFRRSLSFFRTLADLFPPEVVWLEQPSGKHPNLQLVYAVGAIGAAVEMAVPGVPVFTVPPPTWKMAAFGVGNGNAGKPFIMAWARTLGYEGQVQDEADALGVAEGGTKLTPSNHAVKLLGG